MITLEQLVAASGGALRLAPGQGAGPGSSNLGSAASPATSAAINGVHISELEDPTPYLDGGELLLTTGMPWGHGGAEAYIGRLARRGVAALGVGLGPWARSVPPEVSRSCREHGLALVLVPDGIPFQDVSRTYWRLALRDDTAGLRQVLGVQAQLVRAATRPDAVASIVKGVAQALGGWAAFLPTSPIEGPGTVWPPMSAPAAATLQPDLARLGRSGMPAAGTFEVNGQAVVAHPIAGSGRAHGFFVVGSGRTLTGPDRDLIATACTLLSLRVRQRETLTEAAAGIGSAVVLLTLSGLGEAARLLADDAGLGPLPERMRWLCVRTGPERDVAAALASASAWSWDGGTVPPVASFPTRLDDDGLAWVMTPASAWSSPAPGPGSPVDAAVREDPVTGANTSPPAVEQADWAGGALGETQALGAPPAGLRAAARSAAPGTVANEREGAHDQAQAWARALANYPKVDLLGTVTAYLRHRGHWEEVSRALGVHRNTVRHRLGLATQLLGVDLDDPDVSARLWLALRAESGHAS